MPMMEEEKKRAAERAIDELPTEGVVGLGTGSTAKLFVEALAPHVRSGRLRIVCVPTSEATHKLAGDLGIPLLSDEGPWAIDVNVDGADEVSAKLDLIKGGGGAHAREKIVNFASRKNVIIVDESKLSQRLGEKRAVPLEVLPFAHGTTRSHLARFGTPVLRMRDGFPPARMPATCSTTSPYRPSPTRAPSTAPCAPFRASSRHASSSEGPTWSSSPRRPACGDSPDPGFIHSLQNELSDRRAPRR